MQTMCQTDDYSGFFNGQAFENMHNKAKKKGLDKKERKASKEYRQARKNKRAF